MKTYKIDGKIFEVKVPVIIQKQKVYELLKEYKVNFTEFSKVTIKMQQGQRLSDADLDVFGSMTSVLNETDFNAKLAAIWLCEKGRLRKDSYEENFDLVYNWYIEEGTGINLGDFFSMTEADTRQDK